MARLPRSNAEGTVALSVRERRGGTLRPIDEMLLHSESVADAWNTFLRTIRGGVSLEPALRELVILRVAVLNRAQYEWASHEQDARRAGLDAGTFAALHQPKVPRDAVGLGEHAVLAYTDAMTTRIEVDDSVFDRLREFFTDAEIVELTTTIAAYNMVSRFAVALEITSTDEGVTSWQVA